LIEPPLQIHTAGAAGDTTVLIEVHYKGRLILPATPTEGTVGAAENTNCPYRGTLYRNTLGRAAGAAAPTEALEPPLQLTSVVVTITLRFRLDILYITTTQVVQLVACP
jgi:hypothetical protein